MTPPRITELNALFTEALAIGFSWDNVQLALTDLRTTTMLANLLLEHVRSEQKLATAGQTVARLEGQLDGLALAARCVRPSPLVSELRNLVRIA